MPTVLCSWMALRSTDKRCESTGTDSQKSARTTILHTNDLYSWYLRITTRPSDYVPPPTGQVCAHLALFLLSRTYACWESVRMFPLARSLSRSLALSLALSLSVSLSLYLCIYIYGHVHGCPCEGGRNVCIYLCMSICMCMEVIETAREILFIYGCTCIHLHKHTHTHTHTTHTCTHSLFHSVTHSLTLFLSLSHTHTRTHTQTHTHTLCM